MHELIVGRAGAGKTVTLLKQYSHLLQLKRVATILFAVEGSELRILEHLPVNAERPLILVCGERGNFRYNLLSPTPGATLEENVEDILRMFTTLWLAVASIGILRPILYELVKDAMNGTRRGITDICNALRALKYSESRDKVLNRLAGIDSLFFDTDELLDLRIACSSHLVFAIDSLGMATASCFINSILSKILRYKRLTGEHFRNPEDQRINILLLDEAQRFLPPGNLLRDDFNNLPLVAVAGQSRKLGVGLILALQQPSLIHDSFIAQAGTMLAGPLHNENDMRAVRTALGLTSEQIEFYRLMPQRTFLMRKTGTAVFPVTIPEVELSDTPMDGMAIARWNQQVIHAKPELAHLLHQERAPNPPPMAPQDDGYILLDCVNTNPCHMATWYQHELKGHFAGEKADRIVDDLVDKGWLRKWPIRTGAKGRLIGLEPTDQGLEHYGIKRLLRRSRGASFEHTYLAVNIARQYRAASRDATIEECLGEHPADVYVKPDLAIEVALGNDPEDEVKGIITDLDHVPNVQVVGNSRGHLDEVKRKLPEQYHDRVSFELFCDVVNHGD